MRTFTKITIAAALGGTVALTACRSELDGKTAAIVEGTPAEGAAREASAPVARTLALDPAASRVEFVGAKITADHRGSFGNPTGRLELDAQGDVVGLELTVDTQSVDVEPEQLEQHLRSPDFFDVSRYPTAHFRLAAITGPSGGTAAHQVTGDLELRGITKRITFPATAQFSAEQVAADASFKINRKDFGIVYAGMADDLIKDEVLLEMKLVFRGAAEARS